MINSQDRLMKCANEFLRLLKKYAVQDMEVERVLGFFMPWYEKVMKGEITPPCYDYTLNVYFTNPDISPVAVKYFYETDGKHELSIAASDFWAAMHNRLED
jgi:hypothetical protein